MPSEDELRDLLRGDDGASTIDASEVIRLARRRRRPRVIAASAGALVAVAAIAVPTLSLLPRGASGSSSSLADQGSSTAPREAGDGARPDALAGGPAAGGSAASPGAADGSTGACAVVAASGSVPGVSVELTGGTVDAGRLTGSVAVSSTSSATALRITGPVAVSLSLNGMVVWTGAIDVGSPRLALTAGQTGTLPVDAPVADCSSGAALPAGDYAVTVSAPVAIGDAAARVVSGSGTVTVR